jgi:hypothetical protein
MKKICEIRILRLTGFFCDAIENPSGRGRHGAEGIQISYKYKRIVEYTPFWNGPVWNIRPIRNDVWGTEPVIILLSFDIIVVIVYGYEMSVKSE